MPATVRDRASAAGAVFQFFPSCCEVVKQGLFSQDLQTISDFQFFPSCCRRGTDEGCCGALQRFQFFPSCCRGRGRPRGVRERRSFNSFPVAAGRLVLREEPIACPLSILSQLLREALYAEQPLALELSILSQLLPQPFNAISGARNETFNSFPVAAYRSWKAR